MENKKIVKHLIDFQKAYFENCFSMMVRFQQQAENIFNIFHYFPGISEEGKKIMNDRTDAYKKWIDDLKKAMDEGYAKVEAFFEKNSMDMFKDQIGKMFNFYLQQANWMPQDLTKTMEELDATYKKGCDEFKKYVDQNIQSMQNFYNASDKPQIKTKKQK